MIIKVFFWSLSSCTKNGHVLTNPMFCGTTGPRTVLNITTNAARDISPYSFYAVEAEVLLPPGLQFRVMSKIEVPGSGGLVMINLDQVSDKLVPWAKSSSSAKSGGGGGGGGGFSSAGGGGAAAASGGGASSAVATTSSPKWTCAACTFDNPLSAQQCGMCSAPKHGASAPAPPAYTAPPLAASGGGGGGGAWGGGGGGAAAHVAAPLPPQVRRL